VLLRLTSRQTVLRWRPSARAISAWFKPCLLRAASIYLSAGESWRYVMAEDLFVVVEVFVSIAAPSTSGKRVALSI
jgi:hypothetical protein